MSWNVIWHCMIFQEQKYKIVACCLILKYYNSTINFNVEICAERVRGVYNVNIDLYKKC